MDSLWHFVNVVMNILASWLSNYYTLKWSVQFSPCFHQSQVICNTGLLHRFLVAASVGQNPQGDRLTLHHTTLMPNLHGLFSLVCLIFAPSIELRYEIFLS